MDELSVPYKFSSVFSGLFTASRVPRSCPAASRQQALSRSLQRPSALSHPSHRADFRVVPSLRAVSITVVLRDGAVAVGFSSFCRSFRLLRGLSVSRLLRCRASAFFVAAFCLSWPASRLAFAASAFSVFFVLCLFVARHLDRDVAIVTLFAISTSLRSRTHAAAILWSGPYRRSTSSPRDRPDRSRYSAARPDTSRWRSPNSGTSRSARAARLSVNFRIDKRLRDIPPRIRSITSRAFRGLPFKYFVFAIASIILVNREFVNR